MNDNPYKLLLIFIVIIILVLVPSIVLMYKYYNPEDPILYCERNKPPHNNSYTNSDRDNACYTEYWPEYCKIRYYIACPGYVDNRTIPDTQYYIGNFS